MAVVIETTIGDITVDLYVQERPQTCRNFLKLCKIKYYNFCLFHSVQANFLAQTGDPTGSGTGGESVFGVVRGPESKYYEAEKIPKIKHDKPGLLSMVNCGSNMLGSQFFVTLGSELQSLEEHCVFAEVTEGHDVLVKLNEAICDYHHRPYQDIRITHTVVLEDPFEDPPGLIVPDMSPDLSQLPSSDGRIAADEKINDEEGLTTGELEELKADREAKARATILEIVGDIPDSEIAPPENVLFVCKLNPVTTDEDLEIIFSRFGKIKSCEVIRDHQSGDSLQYAFIEFEDKKACEQAYLKMDNVLIDDRRIHVDFSQSVSKMRWRGKGRGVEYLDKTDDKDSNRDPRYNSRRDNYRDRERDRDRERTDRRREDDRRRRERESSDPRRRRRREEDLWREEEGGSSRWEDDRKRRDDRRREDDRRHNGRREDRRRDGDRRRDSERRRNGSDRRVDKERDSKKSDDKDEMKRDHDKEEAKNEKKQEKTKGKKDENEEKIPKPEDPNKTADNFEESPEERKRTPRTEHKRKRSSSAPRKKRQRRESTSSDSSSSDSTDSSSSSSSVDQRKRPKPSVTVAKKYYQGGKLVKVVKKKKGKSSDSDTISDSDDSDSDRRRRKRKYKRKAQKNSKKKKRKRHSSDSDSDSSSSEDSDSSRYKKRRRKSSKSSKRKKKNSKKSKKKSESSDSSGIEDETDKRKPEKYSNSEGKCKVR